ncbi:TetR family transcriptional regulator C-terminal domain-containing protein [Streptomyces sp. NPDC051662]|uniref:TetR family transcriptional regulator C-terminal domain-containing protein n=1 Tax=Streptomyces sp. NPDC051662 TaxID=3154750 RepID=UPI00343B8E9C
MLGDELQDDRCGEDFGDAPGAELQVRCHRRAGGPVDDARRAEFLVRRAFADQAAHNARLASVQRETLVGIRSRVTQAITNGTACGDVTQGIDAADQALQIVAFAEGLALHTHIDPDGTPNPAILAALDDQLGRVCTGTCRRAQVG